MTLELLAGAVFLIVGVVYYFHCAVRAAVAVDDNVQPELGPVTSPVELAWYYRPAEVFLRQVISARSQRSFWRG